MKDQFEAKLDTKADKDWVTKMLKKLKDMIQNPISNINMEDAMGSKKPFGSMCLSCDADLKNMKGIKAEFVGWNKFPARPESNRIAHIGQG